MTQNNEVKKARIQCVCNNCKARKQKCDKQRPKCSRCIKSGKICVYPDAGSSDESGDRDVVDPRPVNIIHQEPVVKSKSNGTRSGYITKPAHGNVKSPDPINAFRLQEGITDGNVTPISFASANTSDRKSLDNLSIQHQSKSMNTSNTPSSSGLNTNSVMSHHVSPYDMSSTPTSQYNTSHRPIKIEDNSWRYLDDERIELFNPKNMIVVYGSISYLDSPFAVHSLVQRDSFARSLSGAIHGNTMMELHSKLMKCPQSQSYLEALKKLQPPTPVSQSEDDESSLPFVQTAMIRWIEDTEKRLETTLSLGLTHKSMNLDESMSPQIFAGLQLMVLDIESNLLKVSEVNHILKKFYEDIYPFFPFMEIPTFESNLTKIMTEQPNGKYKFNVLEKSKIQSNFEILTLFLLVITISLRRLEAANDLDFLVSKDPGLALRTLYKHSQKLLNVLDSFKNTNENSYCCEMYSYVLTYLEPNTEVVGFLHEKTLRLKFLYEIAITLGLHHDPSKFTRYFNEIEPDPAILNLRRKLWIGINSLKLSISIPNGVANVVELEQMNAFLGPENSMVKILENTMMPLTLFDSSISQIMEDKYKLQMILNKLVTSCTPISNISQLSEILENLERSKTFLFHIFSITEMKNNINKEDPYATSRGALLNISEVKNTEILLANINGQCTIMSVNFVLAVYFEEKCAQDWKKYQRYYHKFLFDAVESCSELTVMIMNYLGGKFANNIPISHKYIIDRLISNSLIKIWVLQSSYLTRFSFRLDQLEKQVNAGYVGKWNDSNKKSMSYVQKIIDNISSQMRQLIDLMDNNISREYSTNSYCSPMFRYILHLVDSKKLVSVVNNFWSRTFQTADVPSLILKNVNMKWGLDMRNPQLIRRYLNDPEVLSGMDVDILKKLCDMLPLVPVEMDCEQKKEEFTDCLDQPEILDNFLESNFDMFLGIINNSLGDLPKL